MLKIGQNWGKIANYPPNVRQRSAPLTLTQYYVFYYMLPLTAVTKLKNHYFFDDILLSVFKSKSSKSG